MIFRSTYFLILTIIFLHSTFKVFSTTEDDIILSCQREGKEFADGEDKYVKKIPLLPNEPQTFPTLFIKEQQIQAFELEISQRNFECIANKLQVFSDEGLKNNTRYLSLVSTCKATQPISPVCDPFYPYRIINGTCNNLLQPKFGSTFSCIRRLWPANYEGVSGIRKSVKDKALLPNARHLSTKLIKPVSRLSTDYNALFAYFGQLVSHDVAQFPFTMVHGSKRLGCCEHLEDDQHPQCMPIVIDPSDEFYSMHNVRCFDITRIIPCDTCSLEKRVPMNYLTSWIDLSMVYGQTDARSHKLRRKDGSGKLKSQERRCEELLPPNKGRGSRCGNASLEEYCFHTGDTRSDQHTLLMIFQTLLLREHNRIAGKLKCINPQWEEEKLYQEARRIAIAKWQVIIYKEYLPILLGPHLISKYGLNMDNRSSYNPSIDPSISVEFNAAAFRAHTIIPTKFMFGMDIKELKYMFVNAKTLYHDEMTEYLDKIAKLPAEKYDRFLPNDLKGFLFRRLNGSYGFDLGAINIQRGRDVGIPTYTQMIEYMENKPGTIKKFHDLRSYIHHDCKSIFELMYADVRDIDFFAGIICEKIPDGMRISPTAAEIIAEQLGDRYYIEHDKTLNNEQRKTLMDASLAQLICENTDIDIIQPNAMMLPNNKNVAVPCSKIPRVDLEIWQD